MLKNMVLMNILVFASLTYIMKSTLDFRFKDKMKPILIYILTIIFMTFFNHKGPAFNSRCILLLLLFVYSFIQFKGNVFHQFISIVSLLLIYTSSQMILTLVYAAMKRTAYGSFYSYYFTYYLLILHVLVFIIIYGYSKVLQWIKDYKIPMYSWLIFILPLTTLFFIKCIPDFDTLLRARPLYLIIVCSLLISNFIFITVFINALRYVYLKQEMELNQYKQRNSQMKYDLLDQQFKMNYSLLHDILNRITTIHTHLEKEEYENSKTELQELQELTFHEFSNIYTNSVVLNTLLQSRKEVLNTYGIEVNSTIMYNDFNFMDFCDQIDVFSILLDYCIAQVIQNNKTKLIIIKSVLKANFVVLQFEYPKNDHHDTKHIKDKVQPFLDIYPGYLSIKEVEHDFISMIIAFKKEA